MLQSFTVSGSFSVRPMSFSQVAALLPSAQSSRSHVCGAFSFMRCPARSLSHTPFSPLRMNAFASLGYLQKRYTHTTQRHLKPAFIRVCFYKSNPSFLFNFFPRANLWLRWSSSTWAPRSWVMAEWTSRLMTDQRIFLSNEGIASVCCGEWQLGQKAKLWIYWSIPNLTCGHDVWVFTERTRLNPSSFFYRVAELSLKKRGWSRKICCSSPPTRWISKSDELKTPRRRQLRLSGPVCDFCSFLPFPEDRTFNICSSVVSVLESPTLLVH